MGCGGCGLCDKSVLLGWDRVAVYVSKDLYDLAERGVKDEVA